jgi:hypothetical protein
MDEAHEQRKIKLTIQKFISLIKLQEIMTSMVDSILGYMNPTKQLTSNNK